MSGRTFTWLDDVAPASEPAARRKRVRARAAPQPPAALTTLDEAKALSGSTVILEGGWGEQVYVRCPASIVRCWEPVLRLLLRDLDAIARRENEGKGTSIRYERPSGDDADGGKEQGLWVHPALAELEVDRSVRAILAGRLGRISVNERAWHAARYHLRFLTRALGRD